jgi:uncharacterized membrane protein YkgB
MTLKNSVLGLRIALGLVFLWFGVLKILGYNPVFEIIYASFPLLAEGIGFFILGLFETVIGLTLLFNVLPTLTHVALIGHLLGTLSVFVLGPEIMFIPHFPILSLAGEFVFKNVVLLMAGFVVLRYTQEHPHEKK